MSARTPAPARPNRTRGWPAHLALSACITLVAACQSAATGALITVETDLGAELDVVEVEVRDSADALVSERRSFPRSEWESPDRFSFGVARGAASSFVVRATGYQGQSLVSQAKARVRFVAEQTTNHTLWLTRACRDVAPCADGMVCDARSQTCTRIVAPSEPTGDPRDTLDDLPAAGSGGRGGELDPAGRPAPSPDDLRDGGMSPSDSGPVGSGPDRSGGGADGEMPASEPTGRAIQGTLIDERRRPVAGIEIALGERTAVTDAQGRFGFANVGDVYDLEFVTSTLAEDGSVQPASQVWRIEGISRRDPTLQCNDCTLPQRRTVVTPLAAAVEEGEHAQYAAFGRDLASSWKPQQNGPLTVIWAGPPETDAVFRRLLFAWDTTTSAANYLAYEERTTVLRDQPSELPFTLARTNIPTFNLSGRIEKSGSAKVSVQVWIRWRDGGSLRHLTTPEVGSTFAYVVPSLPNATISLGAFVESIDSNGNSEGPTASTYIHDLTQTRTDLVLALPQSPSLIRPEGGTSADAGTAFEWSDASRVSLLNGFADGRSIHVLTSSRRVQLSAELWRKALPAGAATSWHVVSLQPFDDIDEVTAEGFLGSWTWDTRGPMPGNEGRAASASVHVTSPP